MIANSSPAKAAATKVSYVPNLQLELLHARHQTQSFPKHTHERYAIGVIERGALGFYYRGEHVVAAGGNISLCIPGEPHTGSPAAQDGWTYRMFYFEAATLSRVASELTGCAKGLPFFRSGVIADDALARQLYALHVKLEAGSLGRLEQETQLLSVLARFIKRYADDAPNSVRVQQEARAVTQVKAYLEDHHAADISLEDLSRITQLSRYHLLRTFHKATGIPPHAYLRQVRIRRAKELLLTGQPIAEVALATGFADQSHLNRWFKRYWGFTPGQYRNSVQDSFPKSF